MNQATREAINHRLEWLQADLAHTEKEIRYLNKELEETEKMRKSTIEAIDALEEDLNK